MHPFVCLARAEPQGPYDVVVHHEGGASSPRPDRKEGTEEKEKEGSGEVSLDAFINGFLWVAEPLDGRSVLEVAKHVMCLDSHPSLGRGHPGRLFPDALLENVERGH